MARKDALLRLHQHLISKRDALRKRLLLDSELDQSVRRGVGDLGDAAQDAEQGEVDSQLASLESRELRQVERAIAMIREGRYGICEVCEHSIPIERLRALPFTMLCINCQRKQEEFGDRFNLDEADWESAYEFEGRLSDREFTLGDLEIES
jgi:DnaK suppressor protein